MVEMALSVEGGVMTGAQLPHKLVC